MLESFLIGTNIYFEPIINILLFIARLCSSGNQGVEVIVTSFVLYLFLSSLLKNNFCAISCALLYQKEKKINKVEDRKAMKKLYETGKWFFKKNSG